MDNDKDMDERHLGSSLDDFLAEEGLLAEAEAVAWKRVVAYQISQLMNEQNVTKTEMARRMQTSRAAVDRLLDPYNESATLITLEKAALVLGKRLQVALV
jgi:antitoxin HicB